MLLNPGSELNLALEEASDFPGNSEKYDFPHKMKGLNWVGGTLLIVGLLLFLAAAIWFIYNSSHLTYSPWYLWLIFGLGLLIFLVGLALSIMEISREKSARMYRLCKPISQLSL